MPTDFNYNQSHAMIILTCQLPYYELYDLKRSGDLYRNRDLIELFEGADVLTIDEITPRFAAMKDADGYSQAFEARRAGEVIRWAVDRGLAVECIHDKRTAWRIVDRELNFMAIGPEKNQRVIRIRGLKDPVELADANKLANREIGRRDRARKKEIAKHREQIAKSLDRIMDASPYEPMPEALDRFRIEGLGLIRNYREVLIDAAADDDGWKIVDLVANIAMTATGIAFEAKMAARKAAAAAPVVPDDDADAMGSLGF